ncbi:hypothetical protein [Actomonas aquatica]|uniref:Glycosyl hydrolase family 32 N-terminal domain-containing protein n=1 Tax=Actomonas aquatica TaxID=2866162 RepID=A0ABZ1C5E6_9BACT|nr:hypothetical protein [Opitutus sp. WL0086]WRQ85515.1 hypothetical protein K1X11_011950 [Opitutus sp. WL0086]
MTRLSSLLISFALTLGGSASGSAAETPIAPIELGDQLQLFADRTIIGEISGAARLQQGQPVEREIVLRADEPWEGSALFISSIFEHEGKYHMLYRGINEGTGDESASSVYLCLATSEDGLVWEKPNLGLVEFDGSTANNITGFADGASTTWMFTFLDPRPDVPADERIKAIDMRDGERRAGGAGKGLRAFMLGSADGAVWHELGYAADLVSDWPNAFDGGSVFWSEVEQQFVGYFRWWDIDAPTHERSLHDWMIDRKGVRSVFRSVSSDLHSWTEPEAMEYGDTPREHIYEPCTVPYPRNPSLYITLANRFNPGRRALTLEEEQALQIRKFPGNTRVRSYTFASDANDLVLLFSKPGSTHLDRPFMEAFLRPGTELGNWSSRNSYAPLSGGLLETGPSELSFYLTRHHLQPTNHIRRMSLRTDGFASVNGAYEGGEVLTELFTFDGDVLQLNFSTSGAGQVRVELQNAAGEALPGFALEDCDPLIGDRIDGVVSWRGRTSLNAYTATPIRLRIEVMDADVYSFRFTPVASDS